jgi:hypothetical protein
MIHKSTNTTKPPPDPSPCDSAKSAQDPAECDPITSVPPWYAGDCYAEDALPFEEAA